MNGIPLYISNTFVGALFMAVSIPLIKNMVTMNRFYGIRIKKAFESEENWYKINSYGGKRLLFWSIILICFGVSNYFIDIGRDSVLFNISALAPAIIVIPWLIEIFIFAKKI